MNTAKQIFGYIFIGIGALRLLINLFGSITVPGSDSVNLSGSPAIFMDQAGKTGWS